MLEGLSPLEQDMVRNNERNFCETIKTIAGHAKDIIAVTSEAEAGVERAELLFILKDESHSPATLHELRVNLGLDSTVQAVITTDGSAVIVGTGVGPEKLGDIFKRTSSQAESVFEQSEKPSLTGNNMLDDAITDLLDETREHARKVRADSLKEVTKAIQASLGKSYSPDNIQEPEPTDEPEPEDEQGPEPEDEQQ